jgi:hypothetical protein
VYSSGVLRQFVEAWVEKDVSAESITFIFSAQGIDGIRTVFNAIHHRILHFIMTSAFLSRSQVFHVSSKRQSKSSV